MKNRIRLTAVLLSVMLTLSSCASVPFNWQIGEHISVLTDSDRLTSAEVRLIALQYKTLYESYYMDLLGPGFWDEEAAEGMSFENYVKEYYIWNECRSLLCLMAIAAEKNYSLTAVEEETVSEAAALYYASLSQDELNYTGASAEDAEKLLSRYLLAEHAVSDLISGKKPDVSDEESRVADIQVIHMTSRETAEKVRQSILSGEDFSALAKENTIDDRIVYSVKKGAPEAELNRIIFSMRNNDVSDIISLNDSYYIIRMVNSYNTLMSSNYKANLLAERRFEGWADTYETYASKTGIRRDEKEWTELSLKTEGDFPLTDLFAMFHTE